MKKSCIIMIGICLLLPVILKGQEKSYVQAADIRIVGSGYGLNGTELRAFNHPSGTTLTLVITAPENKRIVEVDDSKCALVKFADDRGHDLLDGVDWGGFPQISKDGRYALIEVTSKSRPSQEASQLFAGGTIHLRAAASECTERIENLKLESGTEVNIRQEVIKVLKVEEENDGLTLVLQINRKFVDDMKDIRFSTPDGRSVEIWGRSSFTYGNVSQIEYNIDIKSAPKTLNIEIDLWEDQETIDLPFKIASGMGL